MRLRGAPAARLRELARLAVEGAGDPRVVELARAARDPEGALRTVQGLPYLADPPGSDDWVAPVAVTLACGGDCEDLSAAFVALVLVQGYQGELIWMRQRGALDHVTARVKLGGRWLWAESTVQGAALGEHPVEAARRLGVRVPGLW